MEKMNTVEAVKVLQRRFDYLNKRITDSHGSEAALLFDRREREAIEFAINQLNTPPMAQEVNSQT